MLCGSGSVAKARRSGPLLQLKNVNLEERSQAEPESGNVTVSADSLAPAAEAIF